MPSLRNDPDTHWQSRGRLLVVGTGIQWGSQTTLAAERAITACDCALFAVADPWAARWIRSLKPDAEALPYPRDGRPRRDVYRAMTERILAKLREGKQVCAVFYGSPTLLARSAHDAIHAAREEGFFARMLPGVSSLECLSADLAVDFGESGCQMFEATDFLLRPRNVDPHGYLVLYQIAMIGQTAAYDGNATRVRRGLALLSERLQETYSPDHQVRIYEAASHQLSKPTLVSLELAQLAAAHIGEAATLCVPPSAPPAVDLAMLRRLQAAPDPLDLCSTTNSTGRK